MIRPVALLIALAAGCVSCAPTERGTDGDGTWVGTITTEGNVTTVVNESGSVWGRAARLVEEATIPIDAHSGEYIRRAAAWATEDRTFVLDWKTPAVRVYDAAGRHLANVGGKGHGLGEFYAPSDLAVTRSGELLVLDADLQVSTFTADGEARAIWNPRPRRGDVYVLSRWVLGEDDLPWVRRGRGRVQLGPQGYVGEPTFPPEPDRTDDPAVIESLAPDGSWVVGAPSLSSSASSYRFEVHRPDGSILVIEQPWTAALATVEEHDRPPPSRRFKPAYVGLVPDRNRRVWVFREMPSRRMTDCAKPSGECWFPEGFWLDAFADDGRFLGSVTLASVPIARRFAQSNAAMPFIDRDIVLAIVETEAGAIMVKRYRLELPGE